MFILDTDILVDHLRGYSQAKDYIERFEMGELQGHVSVVSIVELFAGRKIKEQRDADKIMKLLSLFQNIDLNFVIAKKAGEYVRFYQSSFPDAIIAASARVFNLKIVTKNRKHYERINEVEIKIPYE